ncbi:hypothetical protein Plhal304r1_c003g0010741 [Plasmopara halstedii]
MHAPCKFDLLNAPSTKGYCLKEIKSGHFLINRDTQFIASVYKNCKRSYCNKN